MSSTYMIFFLDILTIHLVSCDLQAKYFIQLRWASQRTCAVLHTAPFLQ